MTPLTFEQAKAKIPKHVMLQPGVDRWREGDETYWVSRHEGNEKGWYQIMPHSFGLMPNDRDISRRPIPEEIIDAMAREVISKYERHPLFDWLAEQSQ